MTNARIERMIREVNAEPAAQFFGLLESLAGIFRPKLETAPAQPELSLQ
jgi:hypothetical protein